MASIFLSLGAIITLILGVMVLVFPKLLRIIVGIYLILIGLAGLGINLIP